jgi:hypothetical protein
MGLTTSATFCSGCKAALPSNHQGPCPRCGKAGLTYALQVEDTVQLSTSLEGERRAEFWEVNRRGIAVSLLVTVVSSGIGLVITGLAGVIVGLLFTRVQNSSYLSECTG